jgi:hypothetical protein
MVEWGLTIEQFNQQPYETINKIIEYRNANNQGMDSYHKKMKK